MLPNKHNPVNVFINDIDKTQNDMFKVCEDFKTFMHKNYTYELFNAWVGTLSADENEYDCENKRIVAFYNTSTIPTLTSYKGISIIWRHRDAVSSEAEDIVRFEGSGTTSDYEIEPKILKELFKDHSNLTMVHVSSYKSKNFSRATARIVNEPCVALYCRVKGIIPTGEKAFPRSIGNLKTDVREGYLSLGDGNEIHSGSEIICTETCSSGSVGSFVEQNGKLHFITCAHLVVPVDVMNLSEADRDRYFENTQTKIKNQKNCVVGEVKKVVFSHGNTLNPSVDAVLVEVDNDFVEQDHNFRVPDQDLYDSGKYSQYYMAIFQRFWLHVATHT